MEIRSSLSSAYASAAAFTRDVGNTASSYGKKAVEQLKAGYDYTLKSTQNNPRAAVATAVAAVAVASFAIYMSFGQTTGQEGTP